MDPQFRRVLEEVAASATLYHDGVRHPPGTYDPVLLAADRPELPESETTCPECGVQERSRSGGLITYICGSVSNGHSTARHTRCRYFKDLEEYANAESEKVREAIARRRYPSSREPGYFTFTEGPP